MSDATTARLQQQMINAGKQLRATENARWHVEAALAEYRGSGHSYAIDKTTTQAIAVALKCLIADRATAQRMDDAACRIADDHAGRLPVTDNEDHR